MLKKILVSFLSVLTIGVIAFGLVACNFDKGQSDVKLNENPNNFDIVLKENDIFEGTMEEPRFYLTSGATTVSEDGSVTKVVNATIEPADTELREIVWTLFWKTAPVEGADINDYFTFESNVTPSGSSCSITCFKPFQGGEAVLRATTVDGGFKADCAILYLGVPDKIWLTYGDLVINNAEKVDVSTGPTKTLYIKASNVLGEVADDYKKCSLEAATLTGKMDVFVASNANDLGKANSDGEIEFIRYDFDTGIAERIRESSAGNESVVESFSFKGTEYDIIADDFAEVRFSQTSEFGHLTVKAKMLFNGFYKTTDTKYFSFKAFPDSGYHPVYVKVVVSSARNNVSTMFRINTVTGVTNLTLDKTEITF